MGFFAIVLIVSCLPSALLDFAMPKWKADRDVQIEDAYKWTYQATRGGEHAAPDRASALKWLDGEWSSLGPVKRDEPIWEPLCPDGTIGRLNLRPFRNSGGGKNDLLTAFLASAREYRSVPQRFTGAWTDLGLQLKAKPAGNLTYQSWQSLDGRMRSKNYPAIHHSESYKAARQPAYRILTMKEMRSIVKN